MYIILFLIHTNNGDSMKKLLILLIPFLCVACSTLDNNPISQTEQYLKTYQVLDEKIIKKLDENMLDTYNDTQKEEYKKVMKEQYKSLTYKIKDEYIDGDKATVTVAITVLDYYKVIDEANKYFVDHKDEFYDGFNYDTKLNDYKLSKLKEAKDKIIYTIEITLTKIDNKWVVDDISDETYNKINGLFEY